MEKSKINIGSVVLQVLKLLIVKPFTLPWKIYKNTLINLSNTDDKNSVESTLNYWMNFNKIDSLSQSNTMISGNNIIQYFSYENGKNGVSVEHYKINQGGHEWFNLNYEGQNTSELIWNFFSKYDINGFIE